MIRAGCGHASPLERKWWTRAATGQLLRGELSCPTGVHCAVLVHWYTGVHCTGAAAVYQPPGGTFADLAYGAHLHTLCAVPPGAVIYTGLVRPTW